MAFSGTGSDPGLHVPRYGGDRLGGRCFGFEIVENAVAQGLPMSAGSVLRWGGVKVIFAVRGDDAGAASVADRARLSRGWEFFSSESHLARRAPDI